MDGFDLVSSWAGIVRVAAGEDVFERAEHESERGAEFVADVGEEDGLGAVELGERFGAAAFLLVGAGVGERGGDLAGDQLDEAGVLRHPAGARG